MYTLIAAVLVGVIVAQTSACVGCCSDGTMRYKNSCYRYERYVTETFAQAAEHCAEINEYLWVPQDLAEFRAVLAHAQPGHITWIGGIAVLNGSTQLDWAWADTTTADPETWMPWEIRTGRHGWTPAAQCLSYFAVPRGRKISKVSFRPCSVVRGFIICESDIRMPDCKEKTTTAAPTTEPEDDSGEESENAPEN